jgi:hypothetical protein|nr:MAG TPA: hypothetical protein [Caudoviricetes sp.]DAS96168.1 MAG TPA: hypothetical protein [Caudoviricetes sp.]
MKNKLVVLCVLILYAEFMLKLTNYSIERG